MGAWVGAGASKHGSWCGTSGLLRRSLRMSSPAAFTHHAQVQLVVLHASWVLAGLAAARQRLGQRQPSVGRAVLQALRGCHQWLLQGVTALHALALLCEEVGRRRTI